MVDEDDDYMADLSRFLPAESVAPVHRRKDKLITDSKDKVPRKVKRMVKLEQQQKVEEQQVKEGLGLAIPSTNIGFKMLQLMGYAPGAALGKHGQGPLEPVNIDLKRSRTGLGRDRAAKEEAEVKARRAEVEHLRNKQKEIVLRADFQERRRDSWHCRKIISNYRRACATYLQLEESSASSTLANKQQSEDSAAVLQQGSSSVECLNTVGETEDTAAEEDDEEEEITAEMLQEILQKLRSQYYYCLFCGFKYDSAEALLAQCPGSEEDDH